MNKEHFCIFYRECIWHNWGSCTIDQYNSADIERLTKVMPSRKMLIKFLDFLYLRGVIEI